MNHSTQKLTSITHHLNEGGSNVPVRIGYDFDNMFNTLSITEPRGRYVESYQLDLQDRITSVTNIGGARVRSQHSTFDQ